MRSARALLSVFSLVTVGVALVVAGYVAQARPPRAPAGAEPVREIPVGAVADRPGTAYLPAPSSSAATEVPASGSGRFTTAGGGSGVVGTGRVHRYVVVVEEGAGVSPDEFAAAVERTLADPRGWTASRRWAFQRVSGGASDLTVHLATPHTTDRLCDRAGVETNGEVSCRGGRSVVINLLRWRVGVPWYSDALDDYRHMVINHEVGHFLGHGHVDCPRAGNPAPVMQRQTFGLQQCVRNPWPHPDGRTFVSGPTARN